ncbi:MAG: type II 3-dehydroquinate dehydratase, partial [Thiovulaceae bacterium]|nr:type II 3-dehydroquinate dehydratase [Sulfurimonadaceae bacterium]
AVAIPTIEVHISNIHRREEFRKTNMIAPVCASSIVGFGPFGYHLAMIGMLQILNEIKAAQEAHAAAQAK